MTLQERIDTVRELAARVGRSVTFMEVCGTHTMAAFRSGLRSLLPENVSLISGPGCPVCVTPNSYVDRAMAIARETGAMVATFGDMLRVPGTESSLQHVKAHGGKVRIVYSPTDALKEAQRQPELQVVFLGVGFETTAPTVAWTIKEAAETGQTNYSVLCAHKTMPNAMAALLSGGEVRIDGFMCPGHVSMIIGSDAYRFICRDYERPCVVSGFEPEDMIVSLDMLLRQLVEGRADVENQYSRAVTAHGNPAAQAGIDAVFEPADVEWRGLGVIPGSGLAIREEFAAHDAGRLFADLEVPVPKENRGCICGDVLRGARSSLDCKLFGRVCTPTSPVGACMVSSEGTCAAYYKYARRLKST